MAAPVSGAAAATGTVAPRWCQPSTVVTGGRSSICARPTGAGAAAFGSAPSAFSTTLCSDGTKGATRAPRGLVAGFDAASSGPAVIGPSGFSRCTLRCRRSTKPPVGSGVTGAPCGAGTAILSGGPSTASRSSLAPGSTRQARATRLLYGCSEARQICRARASPSAITSKGNATATVLAVPGWSCAYVRAVTVALSKAAPTLSRRRTIKHAARRSVKAGKGGHNALTGRAARRRCRATAGGITVEAIR